MCCASPEDYKPIKALSDDFGVQEMESRENYYYNNPVDCFRKALKLDLVSVFLVMKLTNVE